MLYPLRGRSLYSFLRTRMLQFLLDGYLGRVLRRARNNQELTIERAAENLEVDWTTLSRWERNKQVPHGSHLQKITEIYRCDCFELEYDKGLVNFVDHSGEKYTFPLSRSDFDSLLRDLTRLRDSEVDSLGEEPL